MAPGPLFLVSMWRSGSSLLYALLNKHPQVALTYEADLLLLRSTFRKPRIFCDWVERWEFWNGALHRHGLATSDIESGIADFTSAFTSVHQLYARKRAATIWGDKSPNYYDRLGELADNFPDARFIVEWRDPSGTANAILRAASSRNPYFSRIGAAHCGLMGYEVFKKECDRLIARGKPVCQVHYEDLVLDTPSVMRGVCDFLQIPYYESLSQLSGADRSAIYDGEHHANVRSDKIVSGARRDLASEALRAKIRRNVASWHRRYAGAWPPHPKPDPDAVPAGHISRISDLILYRLLRARDRLSPLAFSFLPIWLLRYYRELKARRLALKNRKSSVAGECSALNPLQ
jgi:hypothetical protein